MYFLLSINFLEALGGNIVRAKNSFLQNFGNANEKYDLVFHQRGICNIY